ncbi:RcnB family protein [Stenotrophomonas mori]|uniref:RcnB family protein n=1 Tax=Stenotrophomonas mori TaxID=2871096 RepID=A0ABT0SIL4_9GAMM|nr:RcnB family protein [Stenotrophomonas mori]MCL7715169.1 RcnB family protein [Stenotrophomonas mori]
MGFLPRCAVLVLALGATAGLPQAMAHDDGRWQGPSGGGSAAKPDWQIREEQRQRQQAQREREQERQRQWQEQQRQRDEQQRRRDEALQLRQAQQQRDLADQQRRRDEAWQRSQEAELQRRAQQQRQRDAAWQREQEAIQRRRAQAQAGPPLASRWERGRRYDGPREVVHDWHHHSLRQPARGQQWVRTDGGDYLLLDIANQLIMDALLR